MDNYHSIITSYVCVESSGHYFDGRYRIFSNRSGIIQLETCHIEVCVPYFSVKVHQQMQKCYSNTRRIIWILAWLQWKTQWWQTKAKGSRTGTNRKRIRMNRKINSRRLTKVRSLPRWSQRITTKIRWETRRQKIVYNSLTLRRTSFSNRSTGFNPYSVKWIVNPGGGVQGTVPFEKH